MTFTIRHTGLAFVAVATAMAASLAVGPASADTTSTDATTGSTGRLPGTELYQNPNSTTLEVAQGLTGQAREDAMLLGSFPSSTWFTEGTPDEVRQQVDEVVTAAAAEGEMPTLVMYNLPYRDCAQYSAGGAKDTAAYETWIDAAAEGIGDRPASVILEPDGLGIIPHYTDLQGTKEWCQPADIDPGTAADARFDQLNHAVDAFDDLDDTSVYLDGTSSAWLSVPEVSDRLVKAGVDRATGFFLNASNYQFTTNQNAYGTWVSQCIAYATQVSPGDYASCGGQFHNAGPANDWQSTAMANYGEWTPDATDPALNTSGLDSLYAELLGDVEPTAHFVVDTSRNGVGPWQYPADTYPSHEDWCNPPDRGLGAAPTTSTGVELADAYLWIKVPGESDGQCYRGTEGPTDPARGIEDPAAGQWFAEQARELIDLASPAVEPLSCTVSYDARDQGKGFRSEITIEETGTDTEDWELSWTFPGDQTVTKVVGGEVEQSGATVTVKADGTSSKSTPGKDSRVIVSGTGTPDAPWQFRIDGRACSS